MSISSARRRLGDPGAVEPGAQILHDRQLREYAPFLGHVGDADPGQPMRRQALDRVALEDDAPLGRVNEAGYGLEGRALADAVAAQQSYHFAAADFERDPVEDVAFAVIGVDALNLEERFRSSGGGRLDRGRLARNRR